MSINWEIYTKWKIPQKYKLTKLSKREITSIGLQIIKEFKSAIIIFPQRKTPSTFGFTSDLYHTFKEQIIPLLLKLFRE